jgi:hypothetical protein
MIMIMLLVLVLIIVGVLVYFFVIMKDKKECDVTKCTENPSNSTAKCSEDKKTCEFTCDSGYTLDGSVCKEDNDGNDVNDVNDGNGNEDIVCDVGSTLDGGVCKKDIIPCDVANCQKPANSTVECGSDNECKVTCFDGFTMVGNFCEKNRLMARFVRYKGAGTDLHNLAQMRVFNENNVNIALGKPAIATSELYNTPGRHLTDDNLDTIVHTNAYGQKDEGWTIDLGTTSIITKVQVINRKDCCQGRLNGAVIILMDVNRNVVFTSEPLIGSDMEYNIVINQ